MDDFNFFEDFSSFKQNNKFVAKMIDLLNDTSKVVIETVEHLEANQIEKGRDNIFYLNMRLAMLLSLVTSFESYPEEDISDEDMDKLIESLENAAKDAQKMFGNLNMINELDKQPEENSMFQGFGDNEEMSMDMPGMLPPGMNVMAFPVPNPEEMEEISNAINSFMSIIANKGNDENTYTELMNILKNKNNENKEDSDDDFDDDITF